MRISPDIAFCPSRFDFPMMSRQRAVRCQDDIAAIQGIRRFIPFGNTQADISPGGFGRSGYVLQILTDDDGLVIIALPVGPFGFGTAADGKAEGQAIGIAWDQRFGKDDELCPIPAGLLDLMDDFLQRRLFIEEYRRNLHDSGA